MTIKPISKQQTTGKPQHDVSGAITCVRGGSEADAQKYYDRAQSANKNFITLASVAGGIMVTDFVYTLIRGSKNKRDFNKNYSVNKQVFYNYDLKQVNIGVAVNF